MENNNEFPLKYLESSPNMWQAFAIENVEILGYLTLAKSRTLVSNISSDQTYRLAIIN